MSVNVEETGRPLSLKHIQDGDENRLWRSHASGTANSPQKDMERGETFSKKITTCTRNENKRQTGMGQRKRERKRKKIEERIK